jgi:hypothetical protein
LAVERPAQRGDGRVYERLDELLGVDVVLDWPVLPLTKKRTHTSAQLILKAGVG